MGIKDKLFGGPQNPQQPKIAEEIVNPYYNISQDGTASSSASFVPSAAPNPFQQFQQQQNQPPMQQPQPPMQQPMQPQPQQRQAPAMNNDDRFDIAQPDTPNGYYAPSAAPAEPAAEGWTCECGQTGITGKFCFNCGKPKPEPAPVRTAPAAEEWTCSCGQTGITGKFCINCGKAKPEPSAAPADDVTTPVEAPAENTAPAAEAPAAEGWTCDCGQTGNTFRFCINCGKAKPEPAAAPADDVTTPVEAPAENTAPAAAEGWMCSCGQTGNKYQYCINCGASKPQAVPVQAAPAPAAAPMMGVAPAPQPAPAPQQAGGTWACECGFTGNTGRFCLNCGAQKPF